LLAAIEDVKREPRRAGMAGFRVALIVRWSMGWRRV
jgi:hypothetical protein